MPSECRPSRGPTRIQLSPLSVLFMMLWPIVPTRMVAALAMIHLPAPLYPKYRVLPRVCEEVDMSGISELLGRMRAVRRAGAAPLNTLTEQQLALHVGPDRSDDVRAVLLNLATADDRRGCCSLTCSPRSRGGPPRRSACWRVWPTPGRSCGQPSSDSRMSSSISSPLPANGASARRYATSSTTSSASHWTRST